MGCAQSHDAVRPNGASRITVSPLVSQWVHGASVNIENAITFLKMRGVYSRDTEQQVRLFGFVRNPRLAPALLIQCYSQCRATLLSLYRLVVDGETREVVPPTGFNLRMGDFPGFTLPAPYTVDSIVQRFQESKRCAPNAVALVQVGCVNRALLMAGRLPTHVMADIAEFWKHRATVERITNQVFGLSVSEGSVGLLKSLLLPDSVIVPATLDQCERMLSEYGFGLISQFKVFTDLHDANPDTVHFAGVPRGDCVNTPREVDHDPDYRL